VVDCRDPLFYYSYDLARYVQEVSPLKANVVLLNKADYLTEQQREMWATYFRGSDTASVFFSAVVEEEVKEADADKDVEWNTSKILSTDETLSFFRTLVPKETAPTLTAGFLGYPNVGKSSTINRFLNCKRLQVSFN
jgi:large subunit GTPase 1